MEVKLLAHTPDPEALVVGSAKLCYSFDSIDNILKKTTPDNAKRFINMLTEIGHESPLEHISFTFGIEGVSRALLAQITRHRIASYSVQSQRYVRNTETHYIIPPELEKVPKAKEEFLTIMEEAQKSYEKITELLKQEHKKYLVNSGVDEESAEKAAEKIAIEDARYVLPNATATKLICTFNARSLLNFFNHRCCNRAQWEIRRLSIEMLKLVYKIAPNIFAKSGPNCVYGSCSEGAMCCKKTKDVKEFFKNLFLQS